MILTYHRHHPAVHAIQQISNHRTAGCGQIQMEGTGTNCRQHQVVKVHPVLIQAKRTVLQAVLRATRRPTQIYQQIQPEHLLVV